MSEISLHAPTINISDPKNSKYLKNIGVKQFLQKAPHTLSRSFPLCVSLLWLSAGAVLSGLLLIYGVEEEAHRRLGGEAAADVRSG